MSEEKIFHIGVMIGNVHTQHPMELIRGICEAAKTENVNISFFVGAQGNALDFWNGDENELSAYNYQYNSLYDYALIAGLDAIIISYGTLCIYLDRDDREEFAAKYRSVPLVILEEYDEDSCDSFIISDNFGSMYTIMEHILTYHGYKKVVYLSGPKNNTDSNERERAYLEAMTAHGLTVTSDLDHLKQINDEYGHADGDFALENAGRILKETFESSGNEGVVCGRIGGDEYVTFMICDDDSDTEEVLRELKERCREFNEISDKPYYVEFSTGCITFICSEDYSIAELIGQADKCLYEAKRTRRQNVKK